MNSHPSRQDLAAFVSGQVNEPEALILETHLAGCADCRLVLEGLPIDPLSAALQRPLAEAYAHVPLWSRPMADPGAGAALDPAVEQAALLAREAEGEEAEGHIPLALAQHPRYRVLELLGRGGMGVVYKAEHRFLNRLVALKVIRPRLLDNPLAVDRFCEEVKAAARLSHPNIVTAFDAEQAGDIHFLVMEYVPGSSLAEVVARQGPFSIAEACDTCRQVARGLQHAFEWGMVHRDIKPHNLMRTAAGQVKILDFGLAQFVLSWPPEQARMLALQDWGGEAGDLLGSPDYIAPEQVRHSDAVDIRADLYSLGCTLFHLLAGEVPFPERTNAQKIAAHLERAPRWLPDVRGDVPMRLAHLVCRLMAKDPDRRLQTPAELVEALAAFVPEPVAAASAARGTRTLMGHSDQVVCLAFSPFGFMLASGSHDQTVKLWDVGAGQELETLSGHTGSVRAVAFSPDGRTLATATENRAIRLWDVARRKKRLSLKGHDGAIRALAFHPDGEILVSAGDDRHIKIWDVASGQATGCLAGHADRVTALAFSPDGRWLASGGRDRTAILWNFENAKAERVLARLPRSVSALAFHPNGNTLAVASGFIHLRDLAKGDRPHILSVSRDKVPCLAYSPDGSILAWAQGNQVYLWTPNQGTEISCFEGHSGPVAAVAFSPDGRLLASASADRTIRIWRLPSLPFGCHPLVE